MGKLLILVLLLPTLVDASTCRSSKVKHRFDVMNGYPHGRVGYVVDHVCALSMGGLDSVLNMQYQTIEAGKLKDRVESSEYGRMLYCNPQNSTLMREVFNC